MVFPFFSVVEPSKPKIHNCGMHNPDGLGYTQVKGISSQEGEWPHACLMFHMSKGSPEYFAMATLIAPGVLVTAAHEAVYVFIQKILMRSSCLKNHNK